MNKHSRNYHFLTLLLCVCLSVFSGSSFAQNPKQMKKHAKASKKKQKAYDKPLEYTPKYKDTDGDGVADYYDNCPRSPKGQVVTPFGCPMDRDFDGVVDTLDQCPDVKGPRANKGCPWPDSDNDGLLDKDDKCPQVAGPIANKGCPWADRDNDGVIDKEDKCPDDPGPAKWQGCPDTDGDGINDYDDHCIEKPGVVENKGCPEIKKEEQEAIKEAFENLLFESGKAVIIKSSYPSLNKLAQVLIRNSKYKIKLEGHTDNVGEYYDNMELSVNRAKSVKRFLKQRGVAGDRIATQGFGESHPVDTNDTPEGRKNNRRVEMILTY